MNSNPLLARVKLPGKVFQLPSKGIFYKPGVLAQSVRDGEIQVKPMSALTELKIRSADLLYSAKILDEICAECCPEILRSGQLLSKDVDALFLFLVASTYGNEKSIKARHDCEKAEWHEYQISLDSIIGKPNNKALDHHEVIFACELPNSQVVKLKPVTFEDSIKMMNLRQSVSRKEMADLQVSTADLEEILLSDMLCTIEAVADDTMQGDVKETRDPKFIKEWIRQLPKLYVDKIITAANQSADWGFNWTTQLNCRDCGKTYDYDLDINPINFFTG